MLGSAEGVKPKHRSALTPGDRQVRGRQGRSRDSAASTDLPRLRAKFCALNLGSPR
jgi:hypothetical protein